MNAVIQCLSATAPLTRYFLDGGYQRAVQRNKWGSNGILPKVYHSLMWHLWRGEYAYIAPKTFRVCIIRCIRLTSADISGIRVAAQQGL